MIEKTLYLRFFKRVIDCFASCTAFIILLPLFGILALLVRLKLGSPILFKQPRPGKNEKIFNIYKFRSMTNDRNDSGELLSDEVRLTRFGKFLRATSLDELPSLINIIKGDMSIVGPRPLLIEYLSLYNEFQKKRHLVKPGLTGLAQVSGRNSLSWDDKFKLDVKYIESIKFSKDCKIIFQTIIKVIKREGIASSNSATMEKFTKGIEK